MGHRRAEVTTLGELFEFRQYEMLTEKGVLRIKGRTVVLELGIVGGGAHLLPHRFTISPLSLAMIAFSRSRIPVLCFVAH